MSVLLPVGGDPNVLLSTTMALEKVLAEVTIIQYEGHTDLASQAITSAARDTLAGKRVPPARLEQLLRMARHANDVSS